jgi:adenylate cyclase
MVASIVKFWQELKRRKVIRVAVAYALVAWIVVEVASVLLPMLLLPEWSPRLVTVLALLGFPIAVVLAWVFEMTPEGAKLDKAAPEAAAISSTVAEDARQPASASLPAPNVDTRRSIVVLPFVNLSDEAGQAFFSDGITEEILTLLARQPGLRVISRTSSFTLKDSKLDVRAIAQKLDVELVLEGSVRRAGNQVRIMAQLIDPVKDAQLWSDRFDHELTDIFAVQGEIARSIVGALDLDSTQCPEAPASTREIDAYDYYLRGRQYFYALSESSLGFARQMFQQAIAIDPSFARAYADLANTESVMAQWFDHSPEVLEAADKASRRALELGPDLAEAHSARGHALTLVGDFTGAAREFESALQIDPGNYDALYLFGRSRYAEGKMEEASDLFRQAHESQPDEFQAIVLRESTLRSLGRKEEQQEAAKLAVRAICQRLELNPDDLRALSLGCGALISSGEVEQGLAMARKLLKLTPDDPSALYNVSCAFANAGLHDEALDLLERRTDMGGLYREWVQQDADFDGLRNNPRFQALLERMSGPKAAG